MSFLYVRPDEGFIGGTVAGTVDDTYQADWLIDGAPGYPVSGVAGLSLTATAPAPVEVSLIAVCHHNLTGTVAIGGDVTATVPAATIDADGIPLNSFVQISPVAAVDTVTLTVAESPSIIGELIVGRARTLERQLLTGVEWDPGEAALWEGEFSSLPPYDPGVAGPRVLTGETLVSQDGLEAIAAWWASDETRAPPESDRPGRPD